MGNFPAVKLPDGKTCTSGPNCRIHGDAHKLLSQVTAHAKATLPANPLENETPSDIDVKLAEIYGRYSQKMQEAKVPREHIKGYRERMNPNNRFYRARDTSQYEGWIAAAEIKAERLEAEAAAIYKETEPYDAEFNRRGGWTRAFLVDNTNGHVHKNRNCSTCHVTTQYVWLPSYSGSDENKIVDDAGEKACTVCYPSAPVDVLNRPTRIFNPERQAEREQRAKEKAAREADKRAKAITAADGGQLRTRYYGRIETARTAEIQAVSTQVTLLAHEDGRGLIRNTPMIDEYRQDYKNLVEALAKKKGSTYDEEDAFLKEKAAKKFRKEWN